MINFKGLEKVLAYERFCYIKVFKNSDCEKEIQLIEKNPIKEQTILIERSNNILIGLTNLSQKFIFEKIYVDGKVDDVDTTLVDELVENGYSLHFYKLANFQILSTICSGNSKDGYIPVKSVITSDIKTGFMTLNESLKQIPKEFISNFHNSVKQHESSVKVYQKLIKK